MLTSSLPSAGIPAVACDVHINRLSKLFNIWPIWYLRTLPEMSVNNVQNPGDVPFQIGSDKDMYDAIPRRA